MANPIDRLIGWINPQAGLVRHRARKSLERAYEAASPRDGWRPRRAGASANADHQSDAKALRTKARALVQNVPYIESALETLATDTIGTGIMVRATGAEKDKINKLFDDWTKVCDADGRLDYYGLISVAYAAMEQDGGQHHHPGHRIRPTG
jgi:capsid protein